MMTAETSSSFMKPSGIENIAKPIQVMEEEHKSVEAVLKEIEAVTNYYTPLSGASETIIALYKKLKALQKNVEQHIYIENNILFPKVISLEKN